MQIQDDREQGEKAEYCYLVIGTDRDMSGWGKAMGGVSLAAWACRGEDRKSVLEWVEGRGDMKRVRENCDNGGNCRWRPRGAGHVHIYIVKPGHPALG
jgi:hypothetical protein